MRYVVVFIMRLYLGLLRFCPAAIWADISDAKCAIHAVGKRPYKNKGRCMKPTEEEIAERQQQLRRQAQQRLAQAGAATRGTAAPVQPPITPAPVAAQASSNTLAIVSLVVALAGFAGAGFLYTQLQTANAKLAMAQSVIEGHDSNIEILNDKLSVSGENANLSVDALKIILREQEQEIRKLWDIASKRNRSDIDKNTAAISEVGQSVSGAAGSRSELSNLSSKILALSGRVATVESAVSNMPADVELAVAQNKEAIDMLDGSVTTLRQKVEKVGSQPASGGGASYAELTNMKLEIEDIQIRLDRIQNAVGGSAR